MSRNQHKKWSVYRARREQKRAMESAVSSVYASWIKEGWMMGPGGLFGAGAIEDMDVTPAYPFGRPARLAPGACLATRRATGETTSGGAGSSARPL